MTSQSSALGGVPLTASSVRIRRVRLWSALLITGLFMPGTLERVEAHSHQQQPLAIPDTVLTDQDGREVRFFSDLVRNRLVAINFIFTTCTTICPPMGANYARLQKLTDDRSGPTIDLISISVDPVTDTPQRLKAWRQKLGGRDGWTLLTGPKADVDNLLKDLKVFTADRWDHSPTVLIGDQSTGTWTRANGLASPNELLEIFDRVASGRGN